MLTYIHRLCGGRGVGGVAAVIACTLPLHLHLAVGPSGGCPGFPGRPGCPGRHGHTSQPLIFTILTGVRRQEASD